MLNIELLSLVAVMILTAVLTYKLSFLQNKKIGYISLLQILYLVLIPGFIYTIIFSSLLSVLDRPANPYQFLNNKLLVSLLLLSILYTYGGLAIHGIGKTLSQYFHHQQEKTLVFKVNQHFHRQFSHHLIFMGAFTTATCFALLELNHRSPYPEQISLFISIGNGLLIAVASIAALSLYKKRWLELKVFFIGCWMLFTVLLYAVKPYFHQLNDYPIALTVLIVFSILSLLNLFLIIRKYKKGFKIIWQFPKDLFT